MRRFTVSGNLLVYNERRYIEQAIDNLLSFCDELVIIDGGSTDGTLDYIMQLKEQRIKLYVWPQPDEVYNKGWGEAERRTLLMRLSSCDYIFWMDADELVDDAVVEVIANLRDRKTIGVFPTFHFFGDFNTIRLNTLDDRVWYPNPRIRLIPNNPNFYYTSFDPRGLHVKLFRKRWSLPLLVSPRYLFLGTTFRKLSEIILGMRFKYYENIHFYHYHYALGYKASDLRAQDDAKRVIRYSENPDDSLNYGADTILLKRISVKHPQAFKLNSKDQQ